jgi:integrase/recombinase XerD
MSVKLRKKACAGGKQSYYLDIYHNDKRHYEFLKLYQIKSRNDADTLRNEEIKTLAESIRAKRELELQAYEYDYIPAFKKNIDFIAYYTKFLNDYSNKDVRIVRYSLEKFKDFIKTKGFKGSINAKEINYELCRDFRKYLETVVNGETIYNYFSKFKQVVSKAYDDKIFRENFTKGISNTKSTGLKKQILDFAEIQKLAQAYCGNDTVKRAFLFSLNTGLRFCDVKALKWDNIHNDKLKIIQAKTEHSSSEAQVSMILSKTAIRVIGERGKSNEPVFNLPSHTACLKDLRAWVKNAGIEKHITWHCARHSFAVNLLDTDIVGADIKTVSGLLGHSSLKHTEKYLHEVDKRKKEAINKLPDIDF